MAPAASIGARSVPPKGLRPRRTGSGDMEAAGYPPKAAWDIDCAGPVSDAANGP
jgi:hypothetical protein